MLAIISFVVALGIPLFGVLTGAKSIEAGRNVVAAGLGQARTIAVNEGKYAGVMFYVDPATERTAMSVVVINDPASGLDDPDPYDKYKTWIAGQQYDAAEVQVDPNTGGKRYVRRDRVIGITADADATYRGELYAKSPLASNNLNYFGNYRPTVRSYRAIQTDIAQDTPNNRPPRNGPYGSYTGSAAVPPQYNRTPNSGSTPAPGGAPGVESGNGPFANDDWGIDAQTDVTRYRTGEQQLLPTGIGVQVIVQPIATSAAAGTVSERYLRTGVILFDPQGRLVLRNVSLDSTDALGQAMQLSDTARNIYAGVGLVLYDAQAFRAQSTFTQNDWAYRIATGNYAAIIAKPANPSLTDYTTSGPLTTTSPEYLEEQWLDNNSTPLLINRYSGSLSEAD